MMNIFSLLGSLRSDGYVTAGSGRLMRKPCAKCTENYDTVYRRGKAIEGDDLKSGDLLASGDWFILTVDRKELLAFILHAQNMAGGVLEGRCFSNRRFFRFLLEQIFASYREELAVITSISAPNSRRTFHFFRARGAIVVNDAHGSEA